MQNFLEIYRRKPPMRLGLPSWSPNTEKRWMLTINRHAKHPYYLLLIFKFQLIATNPYLIWLISTNQAESGNNAADEEEETSDKSKSEINDDEDDESGEVNYFSKFIYCFISKLLYANLVKICCFSIFQEDDDEEWGASQEWVLSLLAVLILRFHEKKE